MNETSPFDLTAVIPGEHIYTQIAAISERYPSVKFAAGREVVYHEVHLDKVPDGQRVEVSRGLAELIYKELEQPSFLPESEEMLYSVSMFEKLFKLPQAKVLLAWRQGMKPAGPPRLVGYLIGAPYKSYPKDDKDLALTQRNLTAIDGGLLPFPDSQTWMFDTFAVAVSQRGTQIGKTLFSLMLEEVGPGTPYNKIATFAVNHPLAWTHEMLRKHPFTKGNIEQGGLTEGEVPYRGITVYYMLFDLTKGTGLR